MHTWCRMILFPAQQRCLKPAHFALHHVPRQAPGVTEKVFALPHGKTKVTTALVSSKYKAGSGPELSSCGKHPMSITQTTPSVHVPSLAQNQELLLLILSLMLLPKQTAFRKCNVGYSSLLIIIVWWVSHYNQVFQKDCFNKREFWFHSHCNVSLCFLQCFDLGKENLQWNKWEKNLSCNPNVKLLMKKEEDVFVCIWNWEYLTALPGNAIFCTSWH